MKNILAYDSLSVQPRRQSNILHRKNQIYSSARPESPLKQRKVQMQHIKEYVFLENVASHNTKQAVIIQRYYKQKKFFNQLFKLIQNSQRRQFYNFVYCYQLSKAYRKTQRFINQNILKQNIKLLCAIARKKHKLKCNYRLFCLLQEKKIFRVMLLLYQQQSRLLKIAKYYQRQYQNRQKGQVFNYMFYKYYYLLFLRQQEYCQEIDFEHVFEQAQQHCSINWLVEFHEINIRQKLIFLISLKSKIEQITLQRPAIINWYNLAKYKQVHFHTSTRLNGKLLLLIIDRWQNLSSGRHMALRYAYQKWRLNIGLSKEQEENIKLDDYCKRQKMHYYFYKWKQDCCAQLDNLIISATLAQQRKAMPEFIIRSLRQLVNKECYLDKTMMVKAQHCQVIDQKIVLNADWDQKEYLKSTFNRTLFKSYDEEFTMIYKCFARAKQQWQRRKAFLRFFVLTKIFSNIARLYAALQCWKQFRAGSKSSPQQQKGQFADYSQFRYYQQQLMFTQQSIQNIHNYSHVGNKMAVLLELSAEHSRIYGRVAKIVFSMSMKQLNQVVQSYIQNDQVLRFEWVFIYRYIIFGRNLSLSGYLSQKRRDSQSSVRQDTKYLQKIIRLQNIISKTNYYQTLSFIVSLRKFYGLNHPNLEVRSPNQYLKVYRSYKNPSNYCTFSQFVQFQLTQIGSNYKPLQQLMQITPLCGYFEKFNQDRVNTEYYETFIKNLQKMGYQIRQQLYDEEQQLNNIINLLIQFVISQPTLQFLYNQDLNDNGQKNDQFYDNILSAQYNSQCNQEDIQLFNDNMQQVLNENDHYVQKDEKQQLQLNQRAMTQFSYIRQFQKNMNKQLLKKSINQSFQKVIQDNEYVHMMSSQYQKFQLEKQFLLMDYYLYDIQFFNQNFNAFAMKRAVGQEWDFDYLQQQGRNCIMVKQTLNSQLVSNPYENAYNSGNYRVEEQKSHIMKEKRQKSGQSPLKSKQSGKTLTRGRAGKGDNALSEQQRQSGAPQKLRAKTQQSQYLIRGQLEGIGSGQQKTSQNQARRDQIIRKMQPLLYKKSWNAQGIEDENEIIQESEQSVSCQPEEDISSQLIKLPTQQDRQYETQNASDAEKAKQPIGDQSSEISNYLTQPQQKHVSVLNSGGDSINKSRVLHSKPDSSASERQDGQFAGTRFKSTSGRYQRAESDGQKQFFLTQDQPGSNEDDNSDNYYSYEYSSSSSVRELVNLDLLEAQAKQQKFQAQITESQKEQLLSDKPFAQYLQQLLNSSQGSLEFSEQAKQELDKKQRESNLVKNMSRMEIDFGKIKKLNERQQNNQEQLYQQYQNKYVDSLIQESLFDCQPEKDMDFLYASHKRKTISFKEKQQKLAKEQEMDQKISQLDGIQQYAKQRAACQIIQFKETKQRKEQLKLELSQRNEQKIEIISLMFKRHAKQVINQLLSDSLEKQYQYQMSSNKSPLLVIGKSLFGSNGEQPQRASLRHLRQLQFSSRQERDLFILKVGKLKNPQLLQLFRQYQWKKHIFTPVIFKSLLNDRIISQKIQLLTQKQLKLSKNCIHQLFNNIDFEQEQLTTSCTKESGDLQYQLINMGLDIQHKDIDLDSLIELTAKRQTAARREHPVRQPAAQYRIKVAGVEVKQRIDYQYLSRRAKMQTKIKK